MIATVLRVDTSEASTLGTICETDIVTDSSERGTIADGVAAEQDDARPRGRDEVVASLLAAARDLMAERGVRAVTVRDIAARANVNAGLVHRHFDGKMDLVRAVFAVEAADTLERIESDDPRDAAERMFDAATERPALVQILAESLIEREMLGQILPPDGPIRRLLSMMHEHRTDDSERIDDDFVVAMALAIGWHLYGTSLAALGGIDGSRLDAINDRVRSLFATLAAGG